LPATGSADTARRAGVRLAATAIGPVAGTVPPGAAAMITVVLTRLGRAGRRRRRGGMFS
jgi:hypothetical protein